MDVGHSIRSRPTTKTRDRTPCHVPRPVAIVRAATPGPRSEAADLVTQQRFGLSAEQVGQGEAITGNGQHDTGSFHTIDVSTDVSTAVNSDVLAESIYREPASFSRRGHS